MPDAKTAKTLNFLSVPTAGLLVLFFFLPWVKITCGTYTLAEASGYQLSKGEVSESSDLDQLTSQMGGDVETTEDDSEGPKARPWFWLGIALPLIILLLAGLGANGKLSTGTGGGLFVTLGLVGAALMVCASMVNYEDEFEDREGESSSPAETGTPPPDAPDAPESPESPDSPDTSTADFGKLGMQEPKIETEAGAVLWASLALYLLIAVFGVMILKSRPD